MDDLIAFLRARLDEDEQTARATADEYGPAWTADNQMESVRSSTGADVVDEPYTPRHHIARHDPARVLAEVDAKRRILDVYEEVMTKFTESWSPMVPYDRLAGTVSSLRRTLEFLALPYADHPDYRDEWRP